MKILLSSHCFSPSTGGIETVSELLAREFTRLGHQVRVVTQTEGDGGFSFPVFRRPGPLDLLKHLQWCDVFLQNNISLRTLWPRLLIKRPTFVINQTWLRRTDGTVGWQDRLKGWLLRFTKSIAISNAVARELPVTSIVVGNPFDDEIFTLQQQRRGKELIYVGRLVSDKGVDLLIEALVQLRKLGLTPRLTIAGDGPERANLVQMIAKLHLDSQIDLVGNQSSQGVAHLLNAHHILVVPSRWLEPFGIVALEGIACGCALIGSAGGGLEEAIGPCGFTFPNGDVAALTQRLQELIENTSRVESFRALAGAHLARFKKGRVAETYLELMKSARP